MEPNTYYCRACRSALFTTDQLLPHEPVDGQKKKNFKRNQSSSPSAECTSIFLDPDAAPWVAAESRTLHDPSSKQLPPSTVEKQQQHAPPPSTSSATIVDPDTIYCPHCRGKLGSQSWGGSQCSCGAWVTPSFKIRAKSLDFIAPASNDEAPVDAGVTELSQGPSSSTAPENPSKP